MLKVGSEAWVARSDGVSIVPSLRARQKATQNPPVGKASTKRDSYSGGTINALQVTLESSKGRVI